MVNELKALQLVLVQVVARDRKEWSGIAKEIETKDLKYLQFF